MTKNVPIETTWNDLRVAQLVDEAIVSGRVKLKKSSMKLGPYNGFSGEVRVLADAKIKVAIGLGLIPKATQCGVCGTERDRIDYHAENYARPLQVAPICKKCHLALHSRHRSPGWAENWEKRVKEYGDGTKWFEFLPKS